MDIIKVNITESPIIKVKIAGAPEIKVKIDGTRGDAVGMYAPLDHNHLIEDVQDLQATLDNKSIITHVHDDRYYTQSSTDLLLDTKANLSHTHTVSQITDFNLSVIALAVQEVTLHEEKLDPHPQYLKQAETDLLYATILHNHAIADVTGLQTALNGKASTIHSHIEYANAIHSHDELYYQKSAVDTLLLSKANSIHLHTIADVTGLQTALDGKALSGHTHTGFALTSHTHDDRYFTETETTLLLADKSNLDHTHTEFGGFANTIHNHNDLYFTETEVTNLLSGKADSVHNHDDRYFTELETNNLLDGKSDLGHSHNDLYNTKLEVTNLLSSKQNTLTSGTTIKTINGESLLGSGDIVITGGTGGGTTVNGIAVQESFTATASQTIFTLDYISTGSSIVTLNGLQTTDFTILDDTLTFDYGLEAGDIIVVSYGTSLGNDVLGISDEIVNGVVDKAPTQNVVYDALKSKSDISHSHNDLYNTKLEISDLLALKSDTTHTHSIAQINSLQTTLDGKQSTLVSGTNIKSINGSSLVGSGDLELNLNPTTFNENDYLLTNLSVQTFISSFGSANSSRDGEWNTSSLLKKPTNTYLAGQNNILNTPYGRTGGLLAGNGTSSNLTNYFIKTTYGTATGDGGYRLSFLGGIDYLSQLNKSIAFIGMASVTTGVPVYTAISNNAGTGAFGATGVGSLPGCVGIGYNKYFSNLQVIHKESTSVAASYIDLGSSFPIQSYTHYKIDIIKYPLDPIIYIRVKNLLNGAYFEAEVTTNKMPDSNVLDAQVVINGDGVSSSSYNLSVVKIVLISNYNI